MKYRLLFWAGESGEVTAGDDAALVIAVRSWVEEMSGRRGQAVRWPAPAGG